MTELLYEHVRSERPYDNYGCVLTHSGQCIPGDDKMCIFPKCRAEIDNASDASMGGAYGQKLLRMYKWMSDVKYHTNATAKREWCAWVDTSMGIIMTHRLLGREVSECKDSISHRSEAYVFATAAMAIKAGEMNDILKHEQDRRAGEYEDYETLYIHKGRIKKIMDIVSVARKFSNEQLIVDSADDHSMWKLIVHGNRSQIKKVRDYVIEINRGYMADDSKLCLEDSYVDTLEYRSNTREYQSKGSNHHRHPIKMLDAIAFTADK